MEVHFEFVGVVDEAHLVGIFLEDRQRGPTRDPCVWALVVHARHPGHQSDIEVIEKSVVTRLLGDKSGYGPEEQFSFEINVSRIAETVEIGVDIVDLGDDPDDEEPLDLYGFPEVDPFVLQENVRLVMRALKPAHTVYEYRHLFKDAFGQLFVDEVSWRMDNYYYADVRKYCLGCKAVFGTQGETLTDRSLFTDPNRDFGSISVGATLTVETGPNAISPTELGHVGLYRVKDVLVFPLGDDATARAYTTTPTGLSGTVTITDGVLEDPVQDFAAADEGEMMVISEGPNAGTYRLKTLSGVNGGPVGFAAGPSTRVQAAPSILRLEERMPESVTGQEYMVVVDRLGIQVPRVVTNEDASLFFVQ